MAAESGSTTIFGTQVSDMQKNDVTVTGNKITGTLKYLSTGTIASDWGAGYFLALKFSNLYASATSVKVGLKPSVSSGLVELLGDPDMNGIFKITDKDTQKFRVVTTDGTHTLTQSFDLSGLILEPQA